MAEDGAQMEMRSAFKVLDEQWDQLSELETALFDVRDVGFEFAEDGIDRALQKLRAFEPSVSVIGQVKAGKSTLLNALIAQPGFLPSDVNPWTSVITALHLNSRRRPPGTRALFRFFDEYEWDRLVKTGGRLGEMATRAGFEAEADSVRAQVTQMRDATEARLGDQFKKLLGSSHAYETLEKDTIDRYICYGDPEDLADGAHEGVYADLTKTADLYLDIPDYPRNLCLRDTPGVNDTFMMREQITLNAISESRACVVVLSAHQALTTMDMALLRIICAVDARELIIFVNRMDEMADPVGEEEKIRASIHRTLGRMGISDEIEILFGSGYWATAALKGTIEQMAPASRNSLAAWARAKGISTDSPESLINAARDASGVVPLLEAVSTRIVEGPASRLVKELKSDVDAIVKMVETVENLRKNRATGTGADPLVIRDQLKSLRDGTVRTHEAAAAETRIQLRDRLVAAQSSFVESALDALEAHIATYGNVEKWDHVPMSLRMAMRSAFMSSCSGFERRMTEEMEKTSNAIQDLIDVDLGLIGAEGPQDLPILPQARVPSNLARTLSLDLDSTWWQKFWKFGQRQRIRRRYADVIMSETTPIIDELLVKHFDPYAENVGRYVREFAEDQGRYIEALLAHIGDSGADEAERSVA